MFDPFFEDWFVDTVTVVDGMVTEPFEFLIDPANENSDAPLPSLPSVTM